ncbi:hypothetical protein ACLB2K_070118 [Fragaria x ananassa]
MSNGDRRQSIRLFALETQRAQQKQNQNLNKGKKAGGTKEHHANAATMPSGNYLPERSKLQLLLGKLKRKDVYSIFSEPLNPEEVEDYYHFIKEPMDFGTITTKLEGGSYKTLQEFEHDVTLVWRNAMLFNDSSTVYHKEASPQSTILIIKACAIRNLAKKLFNSLKTDPENFVELPKTEVNRSSTYRPLNTSLNENESIVSAVCLSPQELVQNRDGHGESLLQFVKNLGPSANTFAGPKLQDLNGESIEAIPDRDTRNFSFTNALLGDENPEWDTYSNLGGKPGSNLHKYQRIADIGSYSSTVEEAGQDWKRFRPTEAPPQPVCSQSTSAGWSSQWLEIGPSTSDVKKSVAGQENGSGQDWKRFRPTEAPPQPVSSRLFLPQSTSVGWPSLRRDIGASTSDVKKSISLKDIDEWLRYL